MDPEAFKSKMTDLNFGNVMAAAARDYQKELLVQGKAQASTTTNEEVDLDDLMDVPKLEKLHADRIAALKGHGEYREISEGDFLGEVTGGEKHLKSLALRHIETKFIKLDAEVKCTFFVTNLGVQMLPCVIMFRLGFFYVKY
ncbi:hypothetical protein AQUCO_20700001v1 [Aquilegia coerulea]|uniref:Uncharacterized protein n=1 Tax=Aquilegia coerulea TaxID=218851 RepID=A0A2G5C0M9_AQUCA|nr:hypothetical protein AQUCO_20700001v1 [Aquilegia coerulea]